MLPVFKIVSQIRISPQKWAVQGSVTTFKFLHHNHMNSNHEYMNFYYFSKGQFQKGHVLFSRRALFTCKRVILNFCTIINNPWVLFLSSKEQFPIPKRACLIFQRDTFYLQEGSFFHFSKVCGEGGCALSAPPVPTPLHPWNGPIHPWDGPMEP